jgi:hypothetical protein
LEPNKKKTSSKASATLRAQGDSDTSSFAEELKT